MFDAENGGQVAWLLPAALVLLVAGLALTWRAPAPTASAPAFVLWGGWLLVTGLTFSLMAGIFHAYYTWPWRRRSAPWSAWAAWRCGAGTTWCPL